MKKPISIILFFLIGINIFCATAQNISKNADRWAKVEKYANEQLPESALKELDVILKDTETTRNTPEYIKAFIYKMRFTLEINPDEAPVLIGNFEAMTAKKTDLADQALVCSMTAELYAMYYQNDRYNIDRRTPVYGYVPKDIKEWTTNIFFDKIDDLTLASLAEPTAAQQTSIKRYALLLQKDDGNNELQPTLFDFLAYRRIDLLSRISSVGNAENKPFHNEQLLSDAADFSAFFIDKNKYSATDYGTLETYQQLLAFRLTQPNILALIFADLQRLKFVNAKFDESGNGGELYLKALERLEKKYTDNEAVVEVLIEKVAYLRGFIYSSAENNKRQIHDICADGIARFPRYARIGELKNYQQEVLQKTLNISHKEVVKPNSVLIIDLQIRNIEQLEMTVYRLNTTAKDYYLYTQNNSSYSKKLFPNKTVVEKRVLSIKPDENLNDIDTITSLKTGDYGIYQVVFNKRGDTEHLAVGTFTVSDFAHINRTTETNSFKLYILDRNSGKTLSDVAVKAVTVKWDKSKYTFNSETTATTLKDGLATLKNLDNNSRKVIFLEKGNDKYYTSFSYSYYYGTSTSERNVVQISLFTDRSLYRPSQTVYFKGIAYLSNKDEETVVPNSVYDVELRDANYKVIATQKLKTNEFGSFSGSFVLPQGGLNGAYTIIAGSAQQTIWVEEYKRPTFEIKIEKPTEEVRFGHAVSVKGNVKAYAGYAVPNAEISYRVIRRPHFRWWWNFEPEKHISNGTTTTDENGNFTLTFTPEKSNEKNRFGNNDKFYNYVVSVSATDTKGETQQSEQSVAVGDKSLFILAEIPDKIDKNAGKSFAVTTETLNGEKIAADIIYTVYSLKENDKYADELSAEAVPYYYQKETVQPTYEIDAKVLSGTYNSNDGKLNLALNKLKSGRYKIVFATKDTHQREVTTEKTFILYDENDKYPPVRTYVWLLAPKTECAVGETAKIRFGTSASDVSVLYEIMQGNTVLESRWLTLSNKTQAFDIAFAEKYDAGVTVQFTFVKDEQFFTRAVELARKVEEKKLTPTLSVFRDKLKPNETAEWTVTIPESIGQKKQAELLVGMYDASLDAIRPHNWWFAPNYRASVLSSPAWNSNAFNTRSDNVNFEIKRENLPQLLFSELDWFGLNFYRRNNGGLMLKERAMGVAMERGEVDEVNSTVQFIAPVMADFSEIADSDRDGVADNRDKFTSSQLEEEKKTVQVRTNFNETAFFYPQLRTDSAGNVKFTFTAPESLTRWNVNMLAHSKDLFVGQAAETVVTQKELMVQLNMPRFVRRSDKLVLSANVINLTENELTAAVKFELINPENEQNILLKDAKTRTVTLVANENKSMEWEITEFSAYELVVCKVTAVAGAFSDGEQHYLPVLPDKVLLTESLPLTVRGNQTRTFEFKNLAKNYAKVETQNLAIEFASNPMWYAVQALPTLSAPQNENAMDYFAAYYVNTLASHIANANPKLSATFDRWKKEAGSRDALLSNLEKNAELKNMLLEETPWVTAAANESEQKRRIALLFDLNQQKQQNTQYWEKLLSLQLPSGAFAWFNGMSESRYVTQYVLLNYARLNAMTSNNSEKKLDKAILKALEYIDAQIARDFETLKRNNKNYKTTVSIGDMQWFYLHVRAMYSDVPILETSIEAANFYTEQAYKYWQNATLYGKAATSIIALHNENTKLAETILKSLKENAMKTDEMGMYWAKNTSGYFWNERPLMVHTMLLEAFASSEKYAADVEEMKIWLLKQKQTQTWDSPVASVDAIFALLSENRTRNTQNERNNTEKDNTDYNSLLEGNATVTVGGNELRPASTEAGTGYFKQTIPSAEIGKETATVTVRKNDANIGWGAMYWQFYQNLENVEQAGGALNITKKLFVERMQPNGKTMLPIEQTEVKKGDKIITRLVVTTDRALEYVALKDLRAACLEPVDQTSGYRRGENGGYYQTTKDASTQFFFSHLPKGTFVFEYESWANNTGEYTSGIASVQCQYAPEFVSHSGGERIKVE